MALKWGLRFFGIGIGLAVCLLIWFYTSSEKQVPLHYLRYVSYLGSWTAPKLFDLHMTKTVEFLSNVYIVACAALQGFLVGLCIDFIRAKSGPRTTTTR